MEKITKEMTIPDLLKMDPRAAQILMQSGMQCVGCARQPARPLRKLPWNTASIPSFWSAN